MIRDEYFKKLIEEYYYVPGIEDNLDDLDNGGNQMICYKGEDYDIGYDNYTPSDKIAVYVDCCNLKHAPEPDMLFDDWEDLFENFKIDGVPFKQIYIFDYDKPLATKNSIK